MKTMYQELGAIVAPDGIPIHFGDIKAEYEAALEQAVLFDRSHEGRLLLTGKDRLDLLNRMSTNNLLQLAAGGGMPTIFTNANARILFRTLVYHWSDDAVLVLTGPGRGNALQQYLQKNIFFNDQVEIENLAQSYHQFSLHGLTADKVIHPYLPDDFAECAAGSLGDCDVFVSRVKPLVGSHWIILCAEDDAEGVFTHLLEQGLQPAGGLTFNTLRIRAGRPGEGRELTSDFIPLELGLWDEVSFNKGCYTGQEIIARMESRNKLARTFVRLEAADQYHPGTELFHDGRRVGQVTSSALSPSGEVFTLAVVKTASADPGTRFQVEVADSNNVVTVSEYLGVQSR